MKLVIIPAWLERVVKENSLGINSCLDIKSLESILSKEDLAFYIFLNTHANKIFIQPIAETFSNQVLLEKLSLEEREEYYNLMEQFAIKYNETPRIPMCELLDKFDDCAVTMDQVEFNTCCVVDDTIVITLGKKVNEDHKTLYNLMDDLLTHLHRHMNFSQLVKTPLFKYFLQTV